MDVKKGLIQALQRGPSRDWVAAALSALNDEQVVFVGNTRVNVDNTAADLLRIYRIRQVHCREQGIEVHGMAELIESLAAHAEIGRVQVQPFFGSTNAVVAFWNEAGDLIGCVTIPALDPERGRRNLDFALWKG
jgi:hypothetical protein